MNIVQYSINLNKKIKYKKECFVNCSNKFSENLESKNLFLNKKFQKLNIFKMIQIKNLKLLIKF